MREFLRQIPKMDVLIKAAEPLIHHYGREVVVEALRELLEDTRSLLAQGQAVSVTVESLLAHLSERLAALRPSVVPCINATGTILHTGLGRSVLPEILAEEIREVMAGYCVLEVDLQTGKRHSRIKRLSLLLSRLFKCGGAVAVNNDAAAVMLTLSTIAKDGEVVVSRGELVEIGGSFRLPEIIKASGVQLVEVGTTNRTYLRDYRDAITTQTRAILKVHPSNFRLVGYQASVKIQELRGLCDEAGLPLVYDIGSGAYVDVGEPLPQRALAEGADIVTFSGDKLFGACQAGIILCRSGELAAHINAHPLYRAVRLDKIKIGLLERAVVLYLRGREDLFPTLRLVAEDEKEVRRRARRLAATLRKQGVPCRLTRTQAEVGGGTLPETPIPSWGVLLEPPCGDERFTQMLRTSSPPVFAVRREGRVILDAKCVFAHQIGTLAAVVAQCWRESAPS